MSSRRASRTSISGSDQGELFLECKAAYLSMFNSIDDKIKSKDELIEVLQQAGRNPSSNAIKKYWSSRTDSLTFDDFVDICRKEPETTEDEMMTAFRKIDINGDGYLSLEELYKIMSTKGEKMSREEVKKMIDEVDENGDGKLDYKEFCKMVISTANECKKASIRIMEKKERKKKKEQQNYIESRKGSTAKMGSQLSLQSQSKEETSEKKTGSMISVRSESTNKKDDSKESDKDSEQSGEKSDDEDEGSNDDEKKGNRSNRQKRKSKKSDEDFGSTTTLKSEPMGSTASLKSASKLSSRRQSQTSLASQSASRVTLREEEKTNETGQSASKVSLREEEKTSQADQSRSKVSLREEENTSQAGQSASRISLRGEEKTSLSSQSASRVSLRGDEKTSLSGQSASRISLRGEEKSDSISGSRTSLLSVGMSGSRRSMLSIGDKEFSTPVPTQRKSLARSQLLEDDLPKPSPRSKKDRPRGGAAAKLDRLPEPRNLKSWTHKSIKGCFFLEDEAIVNHHYDLTLEDDSEIWITIQPISSRSKISEDTIVDTALYIVRKDAKEDGSYVAFTELRDSKGKYGKKCNLSAGDYCIYPMTTGCNLKPRTREPKREIDIIKRDKDDNVVLTKAFKKALDDIFEMCDLDDNGAINRDEFGWFNKRTSDETVTDEEWTVVEDKIDLNNDGEITRQGFIQLHQMEAEDEGDPEDLWLTMTNFGFNKELVMDEACPFKIDVYADECEDFEIKVSDIENISDKLAPMIQKSAIDKGDCTKIKGMKDLFLYTYINDGRATIVVDNKSYSKVKVDVDCSSSKNCLSNTGSLHNSVMVRANTQEIVLHLVPEDESYDWTVRCSESILK